MIVEDERLRLSTCKAARTLNQLCLLSRGYQDASYALLHQRDLCHALAEQLLSLPTAAAAPQPQRQQTTPTPTPTPTPTATVVDAKRVEVQQRLDSSLALCRDMMQNLDKSFRHYDERRCALLLASYQSQTAASSKN